VVNESRKTLHGEKGHGSGTETYIISATLKKHFLDGNMGRKAVYSIIASFLSMYFFSTTSIKQYLPVLAPP
jgi:hypothetical protein